MEFTALPTPHPDAGDRRRSNRPYPKRRNTCRCDRPNRPRRAPGAGVRPRVGARRHKIHPRCTALRPARMFGQRIDPTAANVFVGQWGGVPGDGLLVPVAAGDEHLNPRRLRLPWSARVAPVIQRQRGRNDALAARDAVQREGDIVFGKTGPVGHVRLVLDVEIRRVAVVAIGPLVPDVVLVTGALVGDGPAHVGVRHQGTVLGGPADCQGAGRLRGGEIGRDSEIEKAPAGRTIRREGGRPGLVADRRAGARVPVVEDDGHPPGCPLGGGRTQPEAGEGNGETHCPAAVAIRVVVKGVAAPAGHSLEGHARRLPAGGAPAIDGAPLRAGFAVELRHQSPGGRRKGVPAGGIQQQRHRVPLRERLGRGVLVVPEVAVKNGEIDVEVGVVVPHPDVGIVGVGRETAEPGDGRPFKGDGLRPETRRVDARQ